MQTIEQSEAETSAYEKERGKPMPNYSHGIVQANLIISLHTQAKGEYRIISELALEFSDGTTLTPDVVALPKRPVNWGGEPVRCKEIPQLVVEIVSPTQGYLEMNRKRLLYFRHGVRSVWIVEPDLQAVAIYHPGAGRPQIIQQGEITDPITGLTARLEDIFS